MLAISDDAPPFLHIMEFFHVVAKLDMNFDLRARKIGASKCIEVKWNKVEAGACYVNYEVVLKSASGSAVYNASGCNIGKKKICSFPNFSNVAVVQLTVTFKSTSKRVTAKVSGTRITTPIPHGMTPFCSI